jgi:hypothetical protein
MFQSHRGGMNLRYSEILRAVGTYAERSNLTELRIMETGEGLILQGLVTMGENVGERATYQLTKEDLQELVFDAFAQRGRKM